VDDRADQVEDIQTFERRASGGDGRTNFLAGPVTMATLPVREVFDPSFFICILPM
jgi:hypothetical protein